MATVGAVPVNIEANCAICGAPPVPECPHESERLQLAFDQALGRWASIHLQDWVLNHARNAVISTFNVLRNGRYQQHAGYLATLPYYTVYHRYGGQHGGQPPIPQPQLAALHAQIQHADGALKQGIDEDWRRSCMEYPKILDYYFGLLEVRFPDERGEALRKPVFGGSASSPREQKKVKARRDSIDTQRGKKERRRSRGRTPPSAPMVGSYRR
ncbi:hypothetical protein LTR53_005892 [Teratosphaeriaceae sp. CCFEE 6253]|nr:hypothetical protein LTR53_005892 [Teratosphaeriaceae sp. CCFEE 6253]